MSYQQTDTFYGDFLYIQWEILSHYLAFLLFILFFHHDSYALPFFLTAMVLSLRRKWIIFCCNSDINCNYFNSDSMFFLKKSLQDGEGKNERSSLILLGSLLK